MKAHLALLVIAFFSCAIWNAHAAYQFIPNADTSTNLFKYGTTDLGALERLCDNLGSQCAGFNTNGYLKSTIGTIVATVDSALFIKTGGVTPPQNPAPLWPLPRSVSNGSTTILVASPPSFIFQSSISSPILTKAFDRYRRLIFPQDLNDSDAIDSVNEPIRMQMRSASMQATASSVYVTVSSTSDQLNIDTDESYNLKITESGSINIVAKTVYGAMYGLETLSQLVSYNFETATYQIRNAPWAISDSPKFPHRGILIDTSRHFLPLRAIRRVVDSMSYSKLNVLHWHIVDAQSFPMESKAYPKLWNGAWSTSERYSQQEIRNLVQYAKERGVRVMPEFDGPGHAWAWGVGYPEVLPEGYAESPNCDNICPVNPCNVPLDPSNPFTMELVDGLFKEVSGGAQGRGIFTDDFLHLGGDEVEAGCWNNSKRIRNFMAKNNMTTFDDLYMYYLQQAHEIAFKYGRIPVNWEEVFNHFGNKLDKRVVIHVWLDHSTLAEVVKAGYRGILSNNQDWYLDHLNTDWTVYYADDLLQNIADPGQQKLVLGGEACMWGERIDASNIFRTIWPKAAAFAERVWNYDVANMNQAVEVALPRLRRFRCKLMERGIDTAPLYSAGPNQPSSCYDS